VAKQETEWGKVDETGTVSVKDNGSWREVGQVVDSSPEAALAIYESRFAELAAQVLLLEQRAKAGAAVKDLLASVQELVVKLTDAHAVGDLQSLRLRVGVIAESLDELREKQSAAQKELVEKSTETRKEIVARAEAIANSISGSIHWRNSQKEIAELFEKWKEEQRLPLRVPKAVQDELWNRFRAAKQTFEKAQRQYFQTKNAGDKEAKSIKLALCEKALALEPKGASGIPEYKKLLAEWKAAPRGSKSLENELWDRFKKAGDKLYSAGSAEWQANAEAKNKLLSEFDWLVNETELEKLKTGFRQLREKWEKIGQVARDSEKQINEGFRAIEKKVRAVEAEFLDKTNPAKIALRQGFAEQVESSIKELEAKKQATTDAAKQAAFDAEIAAKREWLSAIG
jgi:hypothetical protein